MSSTSIFRFALTMLLGAFLIVIFASYGNKNVHPSINEMIVRAFIKKNVISGTVLPNFMNYSFQFDNPNKWKGVAITQGGFFHTEDVVKFAKEKDDDILANVAAVYGTTDEGPAEYSVREWIAHGGYAADEPEVPASLRHFYDPTKPAGKRYLTDKMNAKLMGTMQFLLNNPGIDGVDWALGNDLQFGVQEHNYTWIKGKEWMKMAMQEKDEDKRSEFMGKAWRALGETLHMIADNGCPAHVRNDAHPSPLWCNNDYLGNPDPYEELVDKIRIEQTEVFNSFADGPPDMDLKARMDTMKTAREIAHALAVFTNLNFVTNETISGKDKDKEPVKQVINSSESYSAPLLENMTYKKDDRTYRSASGVKQCVDSNYFHEKNSLSLKFPPYVDMECVKSQAAALIPNVIAAGVNVMQLFIPKLKIELQLAGKSAVKGTIKHITDLEYISEIKYNGNVTIVIRDIHSRVRDEFSVDAMNGLFEIDGLELSDGDEAFAKINFGGIMVTSDVVNSSVSDIPAIGSPWVTLRFRGTGKNIANDKAQNLKDIPDFDLTFQSFWDYCPTKGLIWSNSSFSFSQSCQDPANGANKKSVTINGELTTDNKCTLQVLEILDRSQWTVSSNFSVINVPFWCVVGGNTYLYRIQGPQIKDFILKCEYIHKRDGDITENYVLDINDESAIIIEFTKPIK